MQSTNYPKTLCFKLFQKSCEFLRSLAEVPSSFTTSLRYFTFTLIALTKSFLHALLIACLDSYNLPSGLALSHLELFISMPSSAVQIMSVCLFLIYCSVCNAPLHILPLGPSGFSYPEHTPCYYIALVVIAELLCR